MGPYFPCTKYPKKGQNFQTPNINLFHLSQEISSIALTIEKIDTKKQPYKIKIGIGPISLKKATNCQNITHF